MYIPGEDRTPFRPQNCTSLYTKAAMTDWRPRCLWPRHTLCWTRAPEQVDVGLPARSTTQVN